MPEPIMWWQFLCIFLRSTAYTQAHAQFEPKPHLGKLSTTYLTFARMNWHENMSFKGGMDHKTYTIPSIKFNILLQRTTSRRDSNNSIFLNMIFHCLIEVKRERKENRMDEVFQQSPSFFPFKLGRKDEKNW